MVCEQTGEGILQMKNIFFTFSLHGVKINKWQNFIDEVHPLCINGTEINKWSNFKDKAYIF